MKRQASKITPMPEEKMVYPSKAIGQLQGPKAMLYLAKRNYLDRNLEIGFWMEVGVDFELRGGIWGSQV